MSMNCDFGAMLRAKRKAAGLTQKAVAARVIRIDGAVGVNTTHISDVECGRTYPPPSRRKALMRAVDDAANSDVNKGLLESVLCPSPAHGVFPGFCYGVASAIAVAAIIVLFQ